MKKDFLSITDLSNREVYHLVESAVYLKERRYFNILENKTLALLFEKPSLRTRVSFELAAKELGGNAIYLSPAEVGLGKREPVADVARVLSRYADIIAARTFSHQTNIELAKWASVPVINALDNSEHPCQALADMLTILEHKSGFKGVTIAYIGDGNNVAASLMLAATALGANFRIAAPAGYNIHHELWEKGLEYAENNNCELVWTKDVKEAAQDADVLYTDVWVSMGQEEEGENRRRTFKNYQVNEKLLRICASDAIIMHPLPAHYGDEVPKDFLNHAQSVVFDQAENRLHVQKAILLHLLGALGMGINA